MSDEVINSTGVEGDVAVTGNAAVGGDAAVAGKMTVTEGLEVGGYLKVAGMNFPAQGVFAAAAELPADPEDGWIAGVMEPDDSVTSPYGYKVKMFLGSEGHWVDTEKYMPITVVVNTTTDAVSEQALVDLQTWVAQQLETKANANAVYGKSHVDAVESRANSAADTASVALALPTCRFAGFVEGVEIVEGEAEAPVSDEDLATRFYFHNERKNFVCFQDELYYTKWNEGGEEVYNYTVDEEVHARPNKLYVSSGVVYCVIDYDVVPIVVLQGQVSGLDTALAGKAAKAEMSVTEGTGGNADKTTIQLKAGVAATVLKSHQSLEGYYTKEQVFRMLTGGGGVEIETSSLTQGKSYLLCGDGYLIVKVGSDYCGNTYTPSSAGAVTAVVVFDDADVIPGAAFNGIEEIVRVTIPATVAKIDNDAFEGCNNLATVVCLAVEPPDADSGFGSLDLSQMTLNVPQESLQGYEETEPWSNFGTIEGI